MEGAKLEGVNIPQAMRERLWTERDTEQKLEALRQQVLRLTRDCNDQRATIAHLLTHQHGSNGTLLMSFESVSNGPSGYRGHMPMSLRDKE